jgi:hypothetical protein
MREREREREKERGREREGVSDLAQVLLEELGAILDAGAREALDRAVRAPAGAAAVSALRGQAAAARGLPGPLQAVLAPLILPAELAVSVRHTYTHTNTRVRGHTRSAGPAQHPSLPPIFSHHTRLTLTPVTPGRARALRDPRMTTMPVA